MDEASKTTIQKTDVKSHLAPVRTRGSGGYKRLSPQEYANAIRAHANLTIEKSIYPGPHFDRIASYLLAPFESPWHGLASRRATEATRFGFAHLYSTAAENGHVELHRPEEVLEGLNAIQSSEHTGGSLLFLRGLPSAEWLANIGSSYRVDPEYFQRHLNFYATTGRMHYYPPVWLPSSCKYIMQLRYMTITTSIELYDTLKSTHISRLEVKKAMKAYTSNLASSMDKDVESVGNSIVRGFHFFGNGHLVLEQAISLCVARTDDCWTALAWIDTGKNLGMGPIGPLSKYLQGDSGRHGPRSAFLPTIQTRPGTALWSYQHRVPKKMQPSPHLAQSAGLLHLDYGQTLDSDLMTKDAFYAFHELFVFCASSQAQFLNMVEEVISEDANRPLVPEELGLSQSNFMHAQEVLENQIAHLQDIVGATKARGSPYWPRAEDVEQSQMCISASEALQKDYEWLLHRAQVLSERCKSEINHLTTRAMLAESRKAIEQSEKVTKLTQLAFIFVPLSFTSSLFGMNLSPLVDAKYSLWVWVVVSFPILIASILSMRLHTLEPLWRLMRRETEK